MINVIISIQPQHVANILSRQKTVEFRTVCFKLPVKKVYIYSSKSTKQIVGYFTVKEIIEGTPETVFRKCGKAGMATLWGLRGYFSKRNRGFGIVMDKVVKFREPIDPYKVIPNFTAPQNYRFLDADL